MTTVGEEVTVATAAKVLRSLLAGRTINFTAADCHLSRDMVQAIAEDYGGFADEGKLRWSADELDSEVAAGRGQVLIGGDPAENIVPAPAAPEPTPATIAVIATPLTPAPVASAAPTAGEPYIAALQPDQLFADPTYQRDLDAARVAKMAAALDVKMLGVLEVSERPDGRFAVIDGQHRWAALQDWVFNGRPSVPVVCRVHQGLTAQDEADLFYRIDKGRRALTGRDRWKARRAAGDESVLAIEATIATFGLVVGDYAKDGYVQSVLALERIIGLGDLQLLANVLSVVTAAYGKAHDGLEGHILQGLALVLANYDVDAEISIDTLVNALQGIAPRQLTARADALREVLSGQRPRLVASVVVDRYNREPVRRKLQPFETRRPASSVASDRKVAELARIRRWAERNGHPATVGSSHEIPQLTLRAYRDAHPAGV